MRQAAPPLDSDDMGVEALKRFWNACEIFDKGLSLLKKGDRYILKYKNNWLITEEIEYVHRLMDPDEYVHDWMINKADIYAAHQLIEKYEKYFLITENPDKASAATFDAETAFWTDTWPRHLDYSRFNFPSKLPDVPESAAITVNTGDEVPVDGIWEPEWRDSTAKKEVVVNIRALFSPSMLRNVQKGCMNYLLAGTVAPLYRSGETKPNIPVSWRLIWQDNRYRDGIIPIEEADYLGIARTSCSEKIISSSAQSNEGGQSCPKTGYWFTHAQLNSRRHFKEGDIMPTVRSDYGTTIWQWDSDQS